jgi:peptide-methionine (S)-S-oxide reductase
MRRTGYSWLTQALAVAAICGLVLMAVFAVSPRAALLIAPARAAAAPLPPVPAGQEEATFAAGCFWSMQAIFEQLKGVDKVMPGYAGGKTVNPSYEQVETGLTGHAETLDIVYDPKVISYKELLDVLLTSRDPTSLNRQGPDEGTQYRSVIFYHNAAQKQAAEAMIAQFNAQHVWQRPIVTRVTAYTHFYPAEAYHYDYYKKHPDEGYCAEVIAPEVAQFRAKFKSLLK